MILSRFSAIGLVGPYLKPVTDWNGAVRQAITPGLLFFRGSRNLQIVLGRSVNWMIVASAPCPIQLDEDAQIDHPSRPIRHQTTHWGS